MDTTYDIESIKETVLPILTTYALTFLSAVAILVIGWIIAGWASKKTRTWTSKIENMDATLVPILASAVRAIVLIITLLAVLGKFGVQTASIIAVLGAAGLAIGLALQGTLSNVASGVMLLLLRPFKVGDVVKISGNVVVTDEIGLFMSKFHSFDNVNMYLPNSSIWGSEIHNFSQNATRRLDLTVGIGYGDDIDKAIAVCKEILESHEAVMSDPAPMVAVESLGDSSVNIMMRAWVDASVLFPTKLELQKIVKQRFDKEKISIPFPQRDVHIFNAN